jgi:hypothetical protein
MTSTSSTHTAFAGSSLAAMARIEARRFARHPLFLLGFVLALGLTTYLGLTGDEPDTDYLSWPVIPGFFIGCSSIVVAARLTRSTESAVEAMATAPGTEARRTLALALSCLVPFAAGVVWIGLALVLIAVEDPYPQEWWFHSASDVHVLGVYAALGPVACLGGGLLGVLVGRWLRSPGAAAVAVVVTVLVCILGQSFADSGSSEARLWTPWALFHSGTFADGTQTLYAGSAPFYLVYQLCLCAAAVLAAVWHDRTARTSRVKALFAGVVVVGLAALALAMTTGVPENQVSDPIADRILE